MGRARDWITAGVLAVVAVAATGAAAAVFAPGTTADQVFAGRFSAQNPVTIANLSVADGRYIVAYSMRVYVVAASDSASVTCDVVDTTGVFEDLPGLERTVPAGRWTFIAAQDAFALREMTLGLRCYPEQEAVLEVLVRDARLQATLAG